MIGLEFFLYAIWEEALSQREVCWERDLDRIFEQPAELLVVIVRGNVCVC